MTNFREFLEKNTIFNDHPVTDKQVQWSEVLFYSIYLQTLTTLHPVNNISEEVRVSEGKGHLKICYSYTKNARVCE